MPYVIHAEHPKGELGVSMNPSGQQRESMWVTVGQFTKSHEKYNVPCSDPKEHPVFLEHIAHSEECARPRGEGGLEDGGGGVLMVLHATVI